MDTSLSKLRTSTIGGFNKKDVITYIEKIRNEHYEYKNQIEKTVKELSGQVAELKIVAEKAIQEKEELIKKLGELENASNEASPDDERHDTVSEINEATNHLKNVADELCRSLRDFIEKISENSFSVVLEGEDDVSDDVFDGEKLMAEIEAEIYAKLGVGDISEETEEEPVAEETEEAQAETEEETAVQTQPADKVSSILSSVSSFTSDGKEETAAAEEPENKDDTVSSILGSLSFLK